MMLSNTLKKQITKFSTHIISFLMGVCAGFLLYNYVLNSWQVKFNPTISFGIDPLNLISAIITVVLAVYVLRNLNKKDEGDKAERELMINYFTVFENEFSKQMKRVSRNGVAFTDVTKVLQNNTSRINELLRLSTEQGFIKKDSEINLIINNNMKCIRDLLTNTPKAGAVEDGIRAESGKLYFSDNHLEEITSAIFNMRSSLFKLIVEINRCIRI